MIVKKLFLFENSFFLCDTNYRFHLLLLLLLFSEYFLHFKLF